MLSPKTLSILVILAFICIHLTESRLIDRITRLGRKAVNSGPACVSRYKSTTRTSNSNLPYCSLDSDDITSGRVLHGTAARDSLFPPWFNVTLAKQGQTFAKKHLFSLAMGALNGLLTGLVFPDAVEILAFTNRSDTNRRAFKRYVGTATQMFLWYSTLLETDLEEEEGNAFLQSLETVRALHLNAANRANARSKPLNSPDKYDDVVIDEEFWDALKEDLEASSLNQFRDFTTDYLEYEGDSVYLNQYIQGMTLIAFIGYPVMYPESLFIYDYTEEEMKSFLHLWAFIAYGLGVDDEFNVCLQKDFKSAQKYFIEVQNKYATPGLFNIDHLGKVMMEALMEGFNEMIPGIGMRPVLLWMVRDFFKVPVPNMMATLTSADKAVQTYFDDVFVPSTKLSLTQGSLNRAVKSGLDALTVAIFGAHLTDMGKALHAFYPTLEKDAEIPIA